MSSRRNGRILAFQAVFGLEFNHLTNEELLSLSWVDEEYKAKFDDKTLDFARLLIQGTFDNLRTIDSAIKKIWLIGILIDYQR